jgi:hypothetical protein
MMRPRYFLVTVLTKAIFIFILVLLAACSSHSNNVAQINAPSGVPEALVESVEVQIDDGALISSTPETVVSQVTALEDGPSLLERHCARCHLVQKLQQTKKPRAEWEKTLAQMEAMGVRLEAAEKVNLLDYLTVADKP